MGKRVLVSLDELAAEISGVNGNLQKRIDNARACINTLQEYCSENQLTGQAYSSSKDYYSNIYIPLLSQIVQACIETISVNNSIIPVFSRYVPDTMGFKADTLIIEEEIFQREEENNRFRRWIYRYLASLSFAVPFNISSTRLGVVAWYEGRILINDFVIGRLHEIVNRMRDFDYECSGMFNQCAELWHCISATISLLNDSSTWDAGLQCFVMPEKMASKLSEGYNLIRRMQLQRRYGMTPAGQTNTFELPPAERLEVERILNGDANWEEKATLIRQVYERYLYYNVQTPNEENPFKKYASLRKEIIAKHNGDKLSEDYLAEIAEPESELGEKLRRSESGIDIQAVVRTLSEDLLRAMPKEESFVNKASNFIDLVNTKNPADLKNSELGEALGVNESESYDFSIWSRRWECDSTTCSSFAYDKTFDYSYMTADYLGNYSFGYIGAGYWQGIDLDDMVESLSSISAVSSIIHGKSVKPAAELYVAGTAFTEALRAANPEMTDEEITCRLGAGVAQLVSNLKDDRRGVDKDITDYINSALVGNWGDNIGDSAIIGDGFQDYYTTYGVDTSQTIRKVRSLW